MPVAQLVKATNSVNTQGGSLQRFTKKGLQSKSANASQRQHTQHDEQHNMDGCSGACSLKRAHLPVAKSIV
jgi:hypothetical protein